MLLLKIFNLLASIRFRTDTPLNEVLKKRYGHPSVTYFRKISSLQLRREKATADLDFLKTCKHAGVIPKFLYFKSSIKNFKDTKLYRSILFKCLNYEIRNKTRKLKSLKEEYLNACAHFKTLVTWLDYNVLISKITNSNSHKIKSTKETHLKKLINLGALTSPNIDASKVIFNFSDKSLSNEEKDILKLGLQFGLPNPKIKFVDHFLPFENLAQSVKKIKHDNEQVLNELTSQIKNIARSSYEHNDHSDKNKYISSQIKVLKNLKKDKSIVITRPDKGKGIVILNKTDYINKTEELLKDTTKFKSLSGNWLKQITYLEDKLNRLLRSLKKKLPSNVLNYLQASGSTPGVLYGLPKVHKADCPIRPILSAINTFNYNLAKFLVPILSPLTSNEYTIKNSSSFIKDIHNINFKSNYYLASFDIKSLFTNIPLIETIDICVDLCKSLNIIPHELTELEFKSLLDIAIKESVFCFNNDLYKQVDGVAMGSPLGPTLANAFLCFYEDRWLKDCPVDYKPIYYSRYVDDCFLVFKESSHASRFLEYLNSKHRNIKFTIEQEENGQLPFLDTLVTKSGNKLLTDVYRKPTYTGLGLNYMSYVPQIFKVNSIKTLIHRAYNVCSNWLSFDEEINRLKVFFANNGYPLHLFEKYLKTFINEKMKGSTNRDIDVKEKDKIRYISLPFYGHLSYHIRSSLSKSLKDCFPDFSFRFVFTNNYTIGSFFNHKDRLPDLLCSKVVYKFTCPSCNAGYIGSTIRNLNIRISEHKGISFRTGHPISNPSYSVVRHHSENMDHKIRFEDFRILHRVRHETELRLAESLYIFHNKPNLNANESSIKLITMSN